MSNVKRYTVDNDQTKYGEYVLYSDYATLEAEKNKEVKLHNETLIKWDVDIQEKHKLQAENERLKKYFEDKNVELGKAAVEITDLKAKLEALNKKDGRG